MLDHQDLDAPSPVLERSAGRPQEELPAPSGASLGLMDPESAVARCYARFLGMELPDPPQVRRRGRRKAGLTKLFSRC